MFGMSISIQRHLLLLLIWVLQFVIDAVVNGSKLFYLFIYFYQESIVALVHQESMFKKFGIKTSKKKYF